MPAFLDTNFFHYIFLPLLSLVSGFVCLYIDPKQSQKTAIIVVLVLAISAVATGASGYMDDQKNQIKQAADDKATQQQTTMLTQTEQNVQFLIALLQASKGGGALSAATPAEIDHTRVQQSLAATVALNQQTAPAVTATSAKPEIQYFSKDIDKEVVTQALRDAGFTFAQKPGILRNEPTNAIWVGDPVSVADLKLVALTLIRAGVQIHSLQRFNANSPRHDKLIIQIGSYPAMANQPVWTVEKVEAMTELPARDAGPGLQE